MVTLLVQPRPQPKPLLFLARFPAAAFLTELKEGVCSVRGGFRSSQQPKVATQLCSVFTCRSGSEELVTELAEGL